MSVIVPVFNKSQYLRRCLDSLIQQTFEEGEYEIICVNDGSTDNSQAIIDEYVTRYPKFFRSIKQQNAGVSAARNTGLQNAIGEYVAFCDSDDFVVRNGYRNIINAISTCQADVVIFRSQTVKTLQTNEQPEDFMYSDSATYYESGIILYSHSIFTFVWNLLYKRKFLMENAICFENACIAEDVMFNLDVFMKGPVTISTKMDIYRYTVNDSQLIGSKRTPDKMRKMINDYLKLMEKFDYYIQRMSNESIKVSLINHRNSQIIPFVSRVLSSDLSLGELRFLSNKMKDMEILPIRNTLLKYRFINLIFNNVQLCKVSSYLYRFVFVPFILPRFSRS